MESPVVPPSASHLQSRCKTPIPCPMDGAGFSGRPSVPVILIVDDVAARRDELRGQLEQAGYRALVARTGKEGLRAAATQHPAGIVVASRLGDLDGQALVRRLRADAR